MNQNITVTARQIIYHRDHYARLWLERYGTLEGFAERCVEIIAPALGPCEPLPKSLQPKPKK